MKWKSSIAVATTFLSVLAVSINIPLACKNLSSYSTLKVVTLNDNDLMKIKNIIESNVEKLESNDVSECQNIIVNEVNKINKDFDASESIVSLSSSRFSILGNTQIKFDSKIQFEVNTPKSIQNEFEILDEQLLVYKPKVATKIKEKIEIINKPTQTINARVGNTQQFNVEARSNFDNDEIKYNWYHKSGSESSLSYSNSILNEWTPILNEHENSLVWTPTETGNHQIAIVAYKNLNGKSKQENIIGDYHIFDLSVDSHITSKPILKSVKIKGNNSVIVKTPTTLSLDIDGEYLTKNNIDFSMQWKESSEQKGSYFWYYCTFYNDKVNNFLN